MILAYLAFAIGLVVSVLYLGVIHAPQSLFRSAAKTLPLLAFTLASYLSGAPAFLTAALFLSALGDLALSRTGRAAFLYGLCSFALAHLVFIILFQSLGGGADDQQHQGDQRGDTECLPDCPSPKRLKQKDKY